MIDLMDMFDDLEEYYEAAGFSDFHENVLKDLSEDEIKQLHENTYNEIEIEKSIEEEF